MNTYAVGTFVDSMTGMEADYFSEPFDVIEADTKAAACSIYNAKHKCDYFSGRVMAELYEDTIVDLDKYARRVDVETAISKSKPRPSVSEPVIECSNLCGETPNFSRTNGYMNQGNTFRMANPVNELRLRELL